ncbi:hypothetical protein [Undibacterium sp. SXout20W]|uniref:hypothetical protein n=1 Tax=Undibacterium sp. SXout20W TaxID=3413051 RepID=UPI003BF380AF
MIDRVPHVSFGNSPCLVIGGVLYGSSLGAIIGAISFWICRVILPGPNPLSPIFFSYSISIGSGIFIGALIGIATGALSGAAMATLIRSHKLTEFEERLQLNLDFPPPSEITQSDFDYIQEWKYQRGEYSKI